ncbi:MAG: hypothetical protein RR620_05635 [Clostridium sp.]
MNNCSILYREVKSYEEAYKYNSENDAAELLGGNEFRVMDFGEDEEVKIRKTKIKDNSSIWNIIFDGLGEVIGVLANILDDFS